LKTLARRRDVSDVLGHQPANGWLRHRAAAARWLCNRGMDTKVAEVVACNGVQHGISVIFSALLRPGDVVATEALNYPFVKLVADLHRAVLAPIPLDGEGMQPEALDRACRAGNVKFLLCTPTMHNPTGITMPPKRREALVRVAQRHDLLIIENDLLGGMATDPPPTIASLARNRTCYVTGLTKIAATGLRLGLVVAPEVLLARVTRAIHSTIWMPPPLLLEIFTMWVDEKILDAIVEWHRREAAARAQLAARIVGNRCPEFRQGGYNVWLRLPGSLTAHRFAKLVERKGCLVLPGDVFAIGDAVPPHPAIRVSLGGMNSRSRVEEGLRLITSVLDQTVGP
jgi:DNA-binding transcriptional MocR family regulator